MIRCAIPVPLLTQQSTVIMRQLLLQSLFLSIFFAITFSVQAVRTKESASDDQFNLDRNTYCGVPGFTWKEQGPKLMDDCDILEDEMKIILSEMTDKTQCISLVDLNIDGERSPRWKKYEHPNTSQTGSRWKTQ